MLTTHILLLLAQLTPTKPEVFLLLILLFMFCVDLSAHLQFSGEYPKSLSILSRLTPSISGCVASAQAIKFVTSSHYSQTVIPLPP